VSLWLRQSFTWGSIVTASAASLLDPWHWTGVSPHTKLVSVAEACVLGGQLRVPYVLGQQTIKSVATLLVDRTGVVCRVP
jgi:hypothetical protein